MEVLQKITVYDLLGYTVPGTIMVYVIQICFYRNRINIDKLGQNLGYYFAVIILLGYVTGMILSEISNVLCGIKNLILYFGRKLSARIKNKSFETENICFKLLELMDKLMRNISQIRNIFSGEQKELSTIGCDKTVEALIAAGIVQKGTILSEDEIEKYIGYMFADIQSDASYSRVHNYASSELVCKNLAIVVALSSVLLFRYRPTLLINRGGIGIGLLSALLLYCRGIRQKNRKLDYTLDWFIQKHTS